MELSHVYGVAPGMLAKVAIREEKAGAEPSEMMAGRRRRDTGRIRQKEDRGGESLQDKCKYTLQIR